MVEEAGWLWWLYHIALVRPVGGKPGTWVRVLAVRSLGVQEHSMDVTGGMESVYLCAQPARLYEDGFRAQVLLVIPDPWRCMRQYTAHVQLDDSKVLVLVLPWWHSQAFTLGSRI